MSRFRLLDTGTHHGRYNVALDQALIDEHRAGRGPDTLRFLSFSPSALVGRHQDLSREVDVDYCRGHGIDVGRRVTGGGAIYLDGAQLGWELVCAPASLGGGGLDDIAQRVCTAAADGLSRLGPAVRFRPRNDLEVEGRKIGGTGGFFDGGTLFYQGTVLIDLDPRTMFEVLRVPAEKRSRHAGHPAAARVTCLREACGGRAPDRAAIKTALMDGFTTRLGLDLLEGGLSDAEGVAAEHCYREEIGGVDFVHAIDRPTAAAGVRTATRHTAGGLVTVHLRLDGGAQPRIESILVSGDFFAAPPRVIYDLEHALRRTPAAEAAVRVARFLERTEFEALSLTAADLAAVVEAAASEAG